MEYQDIEVYKVSVNQGEQLNMSGSCSIDLRGHFGHLIAKDFNVLSGFICEPYFMQGLDEPADVRRVDQFLLLDNDTEDLRNRDTLPEVSFGSLPEIKHDGHKNRISTSSKIVAVEVAYREIIYFSISNPL